MPIYDFRCGKCRVEFEAICRDSSAAEAVCPECGSTELSRLISRFAVSQKLTPCGTRGADAPAMCGMNARNGGCGGCCGGE